jgi:diguanylate cyclase (GGDEF)-like protein/PAS domain S-box-containing protein
VIQSGRQRQHGQQAPTGRSFAFWLVAVQLSAVVPMLAFATLVTWRLVVKHKEQAIAALEQRATIAADAVTREADRVRTRLQLLSTQDAALAGDAAAMHRLALQIRNADPSIASISAVARNGQLAFTTQLPWGTPLPALPVPAEELPVFEDGAATISPLRPMGDDGSLRIGFAVPWRINDTVRYSIRMSLDPVELSAVLREQRWPQDWIAVLLDQNFKVVARSRDEHAYIGKPTADSLRQLITTQGRSVGVARTLDGIEVVTAVVPVAGTPWWLGAGLPEAALTQQAAEPLRLLLAGGAALILAGVGVSLLLSRRLSNQVRRAAGDTSAAGLPVREFHALEMQRLMLDNELIGMMRLVQRRVIWRNRALERIFGYGPGEIDGQSVRRLHVDGEAYLTFGTEAYAVLREGRPYRTQQQMMRKDGTRIWADVSGIQLAPGEELWIVVDITTIKQDQARIEQMVFIDNLTGLPNRALLTDRLQQAIPAARRLKHRLAVCFLDVNGFKSVNDTYGHAVGDALLKTVASRLQGCVRTNETVARLGGDEFILLLPQITDEADIDIVLERISAAIAVPMAMDSGITCHVSAAIGVAVFPDDGQSMERLLALADSRMYDDKRAQRDAALRQRQTQISA